jgi:hypothetical protein
MIRRMRMSSFLILSLLPTAFAVGCRKDGAEATAPATEPNKPTDMAKPADPAPPEAPATPTDPVASWKPFTDKEGAFSVKFPGDPTSQTSKVPTAVGDMELTMYMAQEGQAVFMAAGSPINLPAGTTFDVDKGLQGARDNAMKNMNAVVTAEKDVEISGLKGKELEFTVEAQGKTARGVARFAVRGEPKVGLFQALALSPDAASVPSLHAFVQTLEIK